VEVGTQRVLASRISYVGDLGWEIYVPMEQGLKLWDTLWEAGRPHGLAACGIGVYGTTGRLEKCYRAHGNELETEYNVIEAGMAAPRVKEEDFVGKAAHLRHREEEPAAILCTLTVDDHRSKGGEKRFMLGREPILTRDGQRIVDRRGRGSYVTSAGAGPSVGKHILMAYLTPEEAVRLIEANKGDSVVLTLGPPEAVDQLRDAMALGIDRAIHLQTDGQEWDGESTASVLLEAIRADEGANGPFDIIFFGNESADS